jgi:transposase InsO family protein
VAAPNQAWVGDLTYIVTEEGWLFLAVVIDLFSRRVVGWSMQPDMRRDLVIDALEMAWLQRRTDRKAELIFHSDRGSQYASDNFSKVLKQCGITPSMSRKGNCWDNACSETLFGSLKVERLHGLRFETIRQAKDETIAWLLSYNQIRMHSTLQYASPMQFEKDWMDATVKMPPESSRRSRQAVEMMVCGKRGTRYAAAARSHRSGHGILRQSRIARVPAVSGGGEHRPHPHPGHVAADNGICERFHRTVQEEFYSVAFRKKLYTTLEEFQLDLDTWLREYNQEREHSGIRVIAEDAHEMCLLFRSDVVAHPNPHSARQLFRLPVVFQHPYPQVCILHFRLLLYEGFR